MAAVRLRAVAATAATAIVALSCAPLAAAREPAEVARPHCGTRPEDGRYPRGQGCAG
ncbi:MAG: hypothetical protein WKF73_13615 [Nocardioidaceae bacterium]